MLLLAKEEHSDIKIASLSFTLTESTKSTAIPSLLR